MPDQPAIPLTDAVETFVVSLRQRAVPAVTSEPIQAFLTSDEHHSAATRRRRYSTLCTFYHWLLRHDVVDTNPMDRLDSIEQVQREPRPLAPEAVTKILQAIPNVVTTLDAQTGKPGLQYLDYPGRTVPL